MIRKNQIIRAGVYCLLLRLNMSPTVDLIRAAERAITALKTAAKERLALPEAVHEAEEAAKEALLKVEKKEAHKIAWKAAKASQEREELRQTTIQSRSYSTVGYREYILQHSHNSP